MHQNDLGHPTMKSQCLSERKVNEIMKKRRILCAIYSCFAHNLHCETYTVLLSQLGRYKWRKRMTLPDKVE